MKNLFDDDIFDDGDENTSEELLKSCLNKDIQNKLDNWRRFVKLDLNNIGGKIHTFYHQYYREPYKDLISCEVTGPYSVTLHIKPFPRANTGLQIGIVDLSLFMSIPYIDTIVVDEKFNHLPYHTEIAFTNIYDHNIHISKKFIEKLSDIIEVRDDYDIEHNKPKYISFQNVLFDEGSLEMLNSQIKDDFKFNIVTDCKYLEECYYPGNEGDVGVYPIAMKFNNSTLFNKTDKVCLYTYEVIPIKYADYA